jgi:transcriptional regulator with XRE-family HTH domain/predicted RNase H-like HicB family nuclease
MRYAAILTREGNATLAEFPDAPGCQTFATEGQSIADRAREALEGWLEAHLVTGDVPPIASKIAPRVPEGAKLLWVNVPARLATRVALRRARHEAGLTQAELAKRAGVSQPQVAKLESPDANPTLETLEKVAAALGVHLAVSFDTKAVQAASEAVRELTTELRRMPSSDVLNLALPQAMRRPLASASRTYSFASKKSATRHIGSTESSARRTKKIKK